MVLVLHISLTMGTRFWQWVFVDDPLEHNPMAFC